MPYKIPNNLHFIGVNILLLLFICSLTHLDISSIIIFSSTKLIDCSLFILNVEIRSNKWNCVEECPQNNYNGFLGMILWFVCSFKVNILCWPDWLEGIVCPHCVSTFHCVAIYKAFYLQVAQGRMNGAPNENQTDLWRSASLVC